MLCAKETTHSTQLNQKRIKLIQQQNKHTESFQVLEGHAKFNSANWLGETMEMFR